MPGDGAHHAVVVRVARGRQERLDTDRRDFFAALDGHAVRVLLAVIDPSVRLRKGMPNLLEPIANEFGFDRLLHALVDDRARVGVYHKGDEDEVIPCRHTREVPTCNPFGPVVLHDVPRAAHRSSRRFINRSTRALDHAVALPVPGPTRHTPPQAQ